MKPWMSFALLMLVLGASASGDPDAGRPAASDEDLRYWLLNAQRHAFSEAEIAAALALSEDDLVAARRRLNVQPGDVMPAPKGVSELLPYPGGRHPRIGFLEGAVNPQRETKVSVFLPWDRAGYVVVDLPEAIWSNLGLTYLAHTHVPTIWTKQGIELKPLEWKRGDDGSLSLERKLPNGIAYSAKAEPQKDGVRMRLSLTNGTKEKLSDLRIQNCIMLKGARGFTNQTNDNKVFRSPFVCVHSDEKDSAKRRWIITAWERCHRAWGNPPCPCLHSDPKFADLAPGESQEIAGWLWFYEGDDLDAELGRLRERFFGE